MVGTILMLFGLTVAVSSFSNDESRLVNKLVDGYDQWNPTRSVRPLVNSSDIITVSFGVALVQIVDYDDDTGISTLHVLEIQEWDDPSLVWNPEEYGGLEKVHLDSKLIWRPDIVLFNRVNAEMHAANEVLAVVNYDGRVTYDPSSVCKLSCQPDVHGIVYCRLTYGSWVYTELELDPVLMGGVENLDMSYYENSKNWELMPGHSATKNWIYFECCPHDRYPLISFNFQFRSRKSESSEEDSSEEDYDSK